MSFDIDVYSERPHPDCTVWHETVADTNLTYNVSPVLRELGVSLSDFREGSVSDLAALCAAALARLNLEGDAVFRPMILGNGSWGNMTTVRAFLSWVINIDKQRPGSYVRIH